jgi:acyl dehydratase
MSIEGLAGLELEPVRFRIAREKVAEYVAAAGDDPDRWMESAPPSYAGALLFVAAPLLLEREDVKAYTKVLVHVDQQFNWHRPLAIGSELMLRGSVSKVRTRGASTFVSFVVTIDSGEERVMDSMSTFLLGEEPAAEPGIDPGEPPASMRGPNEMPTKIAHVGPGSPLPTLAKSASRIDLVRYAGASGDFNPIHYDHDAARGSGLDGIVVHGLLMGAWMSQLAAATSARPDPLAELRLRFRTALRPGVAARVSAMVAGENDGGEQRVDLELTADDVDLVTGHAIVRMG